MPEHVHLLLSEPDRGKLPLVIQMLKQITSRQLKLPWYPPLQKAQERGTHSVMAAAFKTRATRPTAQPDISRLILEK